MKLLFIYNANSGVFSQLTDAAHKMLSPDTYECNLCKLTYGATTMKKTWKDYLQSIHVVKAFLHKDEFLKRYPGQHIEFPAIVKEERGNLQELISAHELNSVQTLAELIQLMQQKLTQMN